MDEVRLYEMYLNEAIEACNEKNESFNLWTSQFIGHGT